MGFFAILPGGGVNTLTVIVVPLTVTGNSSVEASAIAVGIGAGVSAEAEELPSEIIKEQSRVAILARMA